MSVTSLRTPLTIIQESLVAGLETMLADAREGKVDGIFAFVLDREGGWNVFEAAKGVSEYELLGVLESYQVQVAMGGAA